MAARSAALGPRSFDGLAETSDRGFIGHEKVIFFTLVMVCSSLFCAGTDSHILLLSR